MPQTKFYRKGDRVYIFERTSDGNVMHKAEKCKDGRFRISMESEKIDYGRVHEVILRLLDQGYSQIFGHIDDSCDYFISASPYDQSPEIKTIPVFDLSKLKNQDSFWF